MMALEKDRQRRYETAAQFAEDLRRHLDHEPVGAGPPSPAYRLRKLVRKHRLPIAAGVGIGLALVAGLVSTLVQMALVEQEAMLVKTQTTRTRMAELNMATMFANNAEFEPPTLQEILAYKVDKVPVLRSLNIRDAWDVEMRVSRVNEWGAWRIDSAGPDARWGTADDISYQNSATKASHEQRVRQRVKLDAAVLCQAAQMSFLRFKRRITDPEELFESKMITKKPRDPWGRRYRIQKQEKVMSVTCAGPDGDMGTADDIVYTSPY